MPKVSKTDRIVDPVALWFDGAELPWAQPDADVKGDIQAVMVPALELTPTPSRRFCTACGAEGVTAARFCHGCGAQLDPSPVSGAGVMAEMAARAGSASPADTYRPVADESQLSPEERHRREQQHLAALQAGRQDVPLRFVPSQSPEKILLHFTEDGFTFAGNVWMRGQEIEIGPGDARWDEAQRWIHQSDSEQMERYGMIRFRRGPWPGKRSYTEGAGAFQQVSVDGKVYMGPSPEQLAQADALERRRNRGVPAPTF